MNEYDINVPEVNSWIRGTVSRSGGEMDSRAKDGS